MVTEETQHMLAKIQNFYGTKIEELPANVANLL